MNSKEQLKLIAEHRRENGQRIADEPEKFKICNGCQSINYATNIFCTFCHAYGFESGREAVVAMARLLGNRPFGLSNGLLPRITDLRAMRNV